MDFTTNQLRAIAAICLLILAICVMFTHDEKDIFNYIMLALAGFLIGGTISAGKNPPTTPEN